VFGVLPLSFGAEAADPATALVRQTAMATAKSLDRLPAVRRTILFSLARTSWGLVAISVVGCKRVSEPAGKSNSDPAAVRASETAAAPLPTKESLMAVWGSSRDDVWAVGDKGVILHFDGRTWKVSNSGTEKNLTGVHGSGPDVWAVGEGGITVHFDGKKWQEAHKAADKGEATLLAVRALGPKDVWTSGTSSESGYLRHYDGNRWEEAHVAATSLWEAWAAAPNDVWMVGSDKGGGGFVLRGDGKKFDRAPFDGSALRGVWGAAADDVWVAAYTGGIHHWDGSAWRKAETPAHRELLCISGSGPSDVWAVGYEGNALHYDGRTWVITETKSKEYLWSVWASAPGDAWAVGTHATLLHWDGHGWVKK
jgi:hypothetical protein